ncbi:hypothetical protein CJ010_21875 [Azoarcus sp. DD4]|uniref:DUF1294 domain-containing protein n=1 Tax=Azoarcus sp. DD4 TaxID=2027405 RepID=UPI00112E8385|nr:cold shock and DUF1294 domain-containing protein [Azoarcus sp. DD4]QDF98994.1 hypothetical protein CJ010_21875 [Azoarcus sp. DD4]
MRLQGRITEWNDDRGFGFVVTHGSAERHFFHISDLRGSADRPAVGRIVSYELAPPADGKRRAVALRYADVPQDRRPAARRAGQGRPLGWTPDALLAGAHLGLPSWLVADGRLPIPLLGVIAFMSCIAFVMYYADKRRAERDEWRVPEAKLQLAGLLGGWLGALAAQRLFRHKSSKAAFVHLFRLAGLAALLALGGAAYPDAVATAIGFAHAR